MHLSRRALLRGAIGGAALGAVGGGLGWRAGRGDPRIDERSIVLPGLPAGFDGFRLALVADVHAGPHMDRGRMARCADLVADLEPDLLVLGGDLVDGRATDSDIRDFAETVGAVRGRHGTVAIAGNHEHFAGIDRVVDGLGRHGIELLRDAHRVLETTDGALAFLCVDDPRSLSFDPPQDDAVAAVLAGAPREAVPILVAHRPAAFDAAARLGIPLTLSGHTHGGQIGLPLRDLTPVRFVTRYVRGLYRVGASQLVVSEGVGTSGLPIRVGVPPAIVVVTLRRDPAA